VTCYAERVKAETQLTEANAKEIAEQLNTLEPDWYCPLAHEQCRTDCVCYRPARYEADPHFHGEFKVYRPQCGNAMLIGAADKGSY